MHSLGREPQDDSPKMINSRGAATDARADGQRHMLRPDICRPSGAFRFFLIFSWGSRPRLIICRTSGAPFSQKLPTHDSSGDDQDYSGLLLRDFW